MHLNTRKLATVAAAGALGLGLVGAGVGASFTDSASASQHVTTGTIDLQLSTDGGNTYTNTAVFSPDTNLGSAGETVVKTLWYKNAGTLPFKVTNIHLDLGGPVVIGVMPGGQQLVAGDQPPSQPTTIAAGASFSVPVTITVPANSPQGSTGEALMTVSGTD